MLSYRNQISVSVLWNLELPDFAVKAGQLADQAYEGAEWEMSSAVSFLRRDIWLSDEMPLSHQHPLTVRLCNPFRLAKWAASSVTKASKLNAGRREL